eukprot:1196244-Prorocentrum_minimum.AAC.1
MQFGLLRGSLARPSRSSANRNSSGRELNASVVELASDLRDGGGDSGGGGGGDGKGETGGGGEAGGLLRGAGHGSAQVQHAAKGVDSKPEGGQRGVRGGRFGVEGAARGRYRSSVDAREPRNHSCTPSRTDSRRPAGRGDSPGWSPRIPRPAPAAHDSAPPPNTRRGLPPEPGPGRGTPPPGPATRPACRLPGAATPTWRRATGPARGPGLPARTCSRAAGCPSGRGAGGLAAGSGGGGDGGEEGAVDLREGKGGVDRPLRSLRLEPVEELLRGGCRLGLVEAATPRGRNLRNLRGGDLEEGGLRAGGAWEVVGAGWKRPRWGDVNRHRHLPRGEHHPFHAGGGREPSQQHLRRPPADGGVPRHAGSEGVEEGPARDPGGEGGRAQRVGHQPADSAVGSDRECAPGRARLHLHRLGRRARAPVDLAGEVVRLAGFASRSPVLARTDHSTVLPGSNPPGPPASQISRSSFEASKSDPPPAPASAAGFPGTTAAAMAPARRVRVASAEALRSSCWSGPFATRTPTRHSPSGRAPAGSTTRRPKEFSKEGGARRAAVTLGGRGAVTLGGPERDHA